MLFEKAGCGMQRILVIGCGGAGKSVFSRALGEKLGLPVVHLDRLFWLPGWHEQTPAAFDAALETELAKERWIMDGNYGRTLSRRLEFADTVIFLRYSRLCCLAGVFRRRNGGVSGKTGGGRRRKLAAAVLSGILLEAAQPVAGGSLRLPSAFQVGATHPRISRTAVRMFSIPASLPSPSAPQATRPDSGPTKRTPRLRSVSAFARQAG